MTAAGIARRTVGTMRGIGRGCASLLYGALVLPPALLVFLPGVRRLRLRSGELLRSWAQRAWSAGLLRILGVRLVVTGRLPPAPYLIAANHITWLDILLLYSLAPVHIVAKSEIRGWPLVGRLATWTGTIYFERGRATARAEVVEQLAACLLRGEPVAVFAEGGILPEPGVKRFHAPLLAAAEQTGAPVVPVALRYWRGGDLHAEVVLSNTQGALAVLIRRLTGPRIEAQIGIGEPIQSVGAGRDELARAAEEIVVALYGHRAPPRQRGGRKG